MRRFSAPLARRQYHNTIISRPFRRQWPPTSASSASLPSLFRVFQSCGLAPSPSALASVHNNCIRTCSKLPATNTHDTVTNQPSQPQPPPSRSLQTQRPTPIDFSTASQIIGEESQILQVQLRPNQLLRAESGAMLYMTEGIHMETTMGSNNNTNMGGGGGWKTGLTRIMTGQNLMVSDFTYNNNIILPDSTTTTNTQQQSQPQQSHQSNHNDNYGTVALGTDFPAKILKFSMQQYPQSKLLCQKGAFLAGSHTVEMTMAFTKSMGAGFFGGEGFVLQSLRGGVNDNDNDNDGGGGSSTGSNGVAQEDTVFLKAYGAIAHKTLRPNETLRISSGSLVCMTSTIDYDITVLPGWKNVVFGGEGLFVTTLTGPGEVWLQGMPVDRMVGEIARRVGGGGFGGIGLGVPMFGGGGGGDSGKGSGDVVDGVHGVDGSGDVDGIDAGGEGAIDSNDVPLTESAVQSDRNATIASSGMAASSPDPDSPESLFGDVAYGGDDDPSFASTMSENTTTTTQEDVDYSENIPEFEETTEMSSGMEEEQLFEDDDSTSFSKFEDENNGAGGEEAPIPDVEEGPGLFSQLWDFFTDNDDD